MEYGFICKVYDKRKIIVGVEFPAIQRRQNPVGGRRYDLKADAMAGSAAMVVFRAGLREIVLIVAFVTVIKRTRNEGRNIYY